MRRKVCVRQHEKTEDRSVCDVQVEVNACVHKRYKDNSLLFPSSLRRLGLQSKD